MSTPSSIAATASQHAQEATVVEAASAPCVLQMIPSAHHHQGRDQDQVQLATTMRSLVLDHQHPIALEIAGTDQQRSLLIRARNPDDLSHVRTQLQARLPHASFVALAGRDDPFHLERGETVSVVELQAGQASYLPLQEFEHRNSGDDPILGILAAVDALPSDIRAIAQIALVPAPPTWSQPYQRKALEHALEPERQQDRRKQLVGRSDVGAPSTMLLVVGGLFLTGYFLLQYNPKLMPVWMPGTFQTLLHGNWQQVLSGPHHLEVEGIIGGLVLLPLLPLVLLHVWKRLVRPPLYDMRGVAEKTSRSAYQVRLRLYVIGPDAATSPNTRLWHRFLSTLCMIGRVLWATLRIIGHVLHTSGALALARQWKHATTALFLPFIQLGKRMWKSQWAISLRMAVIVGWFGLSRVLSHLRERQWKRAARAAFILALLAGKGAWLLGKRGYGALVVPLMKGVERRWQHGRETRYQRGRRRLILARLTAAYRQYHLASGNYFVPKNVRTRRARRWLNRGTWWKGVARSQHLIDVEALAALWHVPTDASLPDLARFAYRRSRSRLLPLGLAHAQQEIPIGFSEHAGHRVAFGVPVDCFESHLLIGGKSGEGKSTLLLQLILRRLKEKGGLILIDPHGDFADQTLGLIPPERWDDVVFIDLSNEDFACGINVLDTTMARGRDKIISDLIKIFSALWTSWGSRMEISFEYGLKTLYEANKSLCRQGKADQQYTLLDLMPLLTEESFCHALLEDIEDPFVRRWWASYYDPLSLQMQRDRSDPVLSKVAKFEGIIARHIVGQSRCSIDFAACIQQQKIVVIKLAKGVIGEDVARILGATLLGFLNVALEEQGKVEGAERHHVPIFIDEFQTLDGVNWEAALAELRKYGASYFLATQSLEYLREKQLLTVVQASVKQFAIFRMSAEDAKILHHELDVDPEDIIHLESLTCYLKFLSRGRQHLTFSCQLSFPPPGKKEDAQQIRMRCQRRYMHPVSEISVSIFEHMARVLAAAPSQAGEDKKTKDTTTEQQHQGRARQEGGQRGRKGQEKQQGKTSQQGDHKHDASDGEITNLNWKETVGPSYSERSDEEEQEEDPGDRAEEN